jgi:hypothetical protein
VTLVFETRKFQGQTYECVGYRAYTRADGTPSRLKRWRSHCADCGAEFVIETSAVADKFSPNRRCDKHKKAGRTVNGGRQIVYLRGGKTVVKTVRNGGRNGGTAAE